MKLYKYYSPESFDFIFNDEGISLRFSQPELLNDPFEANLGLGLTKKDEINEVISSTLNLLDIEKNKINSNEETTDEIKKEAMTSLDIACEELIEGYKNELAILREKYQNIYSYSDIGILSLSQNENSREMWAHYAKNHTGFMIEMDINDFEPYKYAQYLETEKKYFWHERIRRIFK